MFEFLSEMINKKGKVRKVKLHLSENFLKFVLNNRIKASDLLMDFKEECEICYVDISKNAGYVKIMTTSKYLHILKKNKIDGMENEFLKYYKDKENDIKEVEQSIQEMRIGRFINNIVEIEPYDVETFVIRYKYFQENEVKIM